MDPINRRNRKMEKGLKFVVSTATSIGNREEQQDKARVVQKESQMIAVLCDGMGGSKGGGQASKIASRCFIYDLINIGLNETVAENLRTEVENLNEKIVHLQMEKDELKTAGTTLVGVVIQQNKMWYVSVGDSRVYLYRKEKLMQLSTDHNVNEQLKKYCIEGSISKSDYESFCQDKRAEALTSYLGLAKKNEIDQNNIAIEIKANDKIIMCSDGLYKALPTNKIQELITLGKKESPKGETLAQRLISSAIQKQIRNFDNTTVIAIEIEKGKEEVK